MFSTIASEISERPARAAVWLVLASSLLHLLIIGNFALSVDEAHYALYGLKPDWSYFDHPPLVGWLQALIVPLAQSEFALRLWPIVMAAIASYLLYRLSGELFPDQPPQLALISVAILQSAIIYQLISMALVPESLLLVFGLAAALFLYRAVNLNRPRDWLLLGLTLGLAGLSKYSAIVLVVSAFIYLTMQRRWSLLLTPWPWIAALIGLLVIVPVLFWNMTHDWLSFSYQLGHGAPDRAWQVGRFFKAQAAQLFAYSPGVYLFGVIALIVAFRERSDEGVRFTLALAVPFLLLFAWGAGFEITLPHWTLLAWAIVAPLTARWLLYEWPRRSWVRTLGRLSIIYSVVLILLIHSLFLSPWLGFQEYRHPLGDLLGWREGAERAVSLINELPEHGDDPILFVGNWSLASRVAWYARPMRVQVTDERFDQFDLWFGSPQPDASGVLIVPDYYLGREQVSGLAKFEQCRALDRFDYKLHDRPVHSFYYYFCQGYHG